MFTAALKQIEEARAMGAKIQFVLDSNDGGISTMHSYSEMFEAPLGKSIEGYTQVYDARDPKKIITEPMRDPLGVGLNIPLVQQAVERALVKYKTK
jgi:hypothetical protein